MTYGLAKDLFLWLNDNIGYISGENYLNLYYNFETKIFFSLSKGVYNLILDKSCYNSVLQLITTWADVRLKKNKCDSLRNFSSINIYPEFVSKLYLVQYRSVDYQ
jgi:hypothetical protein